MWTLVDGEQRHAENGDRFYIPEEWERNSLKPGDLAKMIFESEETGGERMWVEVSSSVDGVYVGELVNSPVVIEDLEYGYPVAFQAKNIIDVIYKGGKNE